MTWVQRWCSIVIVLLAFAARVWMLDYKPAHFDEGVNGSFVDKMLDSPTPPEPEENFAPPVRGYYQYDPGNYHGPLHFYVLFAGQQLFGRSLWTLRMPTVLLGTGVVMLLLAFRRFLPFRAVGLAALFTAVSPAMIFYSRYAIHEMWLPFFALLACYGGFGLAQGTRRRPDLWCLAMGLTGMVLTKETYILHFVAALLAMFFIGLGNVRVRGPASARRPRPADLFIGKSEEPADTELPAPEPAPSDGITTRDSLAVWGVAFGLLIAFYSSFGFHWSGVSGLVTTFSEMQIKAVATGEDDHGKEALYWIKLMGYYEWPALAGMLAAFFIAVPRSAWAGALFVLTGVGLLCHDLMDHPAMQNSPAPAVAAATVSAGDGPAASAPAKPLAREDDFLRPNLRLTLEGAAGAAIILLGLGFFLAKPAPERATRWLALYGLASLAAYSLIPYKTPWCSINFLWPFSLVLGCVLDRLIKAAGLGATSLVALLLLYANLPDAWRLNFVNPVDDAVPPSAPNKPPGARYAYVQTTFDINHLLRPLRQLVARDANNRYLTGIVLAEAHPLQWQLGDWPNVTFRSEKEHLESYDAGFILVPEHRAEEVEETLTTRYYRSAYQPRDSAEWCWLYLEATRFAPLLPPDRVPEFIPHRPPPAGILTPPAGTLAP